MKIWKVSMVGAIILAVSVCTLLIKIEWEQKVEKLQLLNRVTNEELQMTKQRVKEQEAELRKKDKEIAYLESQPK